MSKAIDHKGIKYNHLLMLYPIPPNPQVKTNKTLWMAECECGAHVEVCARQVKHGRTKSCGKCDIHRRLISNRAKSREMRNWLRTLYSRAVRDSVRRGLKWELTIKEYDEMITKSCFLCGKPPSHRVPQTRRMYTPISQIENGRGYTVSNCIPSCTDCSRLRGKLNLIDFMDLANKILNHIRSSLTPNV